MVNLDNLNNMTISITNGPSIPSKFTEERINNADVPEGWFKYETRYDEESNYFFDTIEASVAVNFKGTLLTSEELELKEHTESGKPDKYLAINTDFNYTFNA